jgi:hypothetical protein
MKNLLKKVPHLVLIIGGLITALFFTLLFAVLYYFIGLDSDVWAKNSLFSLVRSIDFASFLSIFIFVLIYMLLMDALLVGVRVLWWRVLERPTRLPKDNFFKRYWRNHRTVHLTFILLTIFLPIAISTPSAIMNTFTAIVSISVLVSNLTKKKEPKD